MLLQVQFEHPALLEGRGAVWLAALWGDSGVVKTTAAAAAGRSSSSRAKTSGAIWWFLHSRQTLKYLVLSPWL